MLIEWLYELKESVDRHGLRWGVAITIYALIRKERRNIRLDKRDDAIFQNQKLIMDHLGIGEQWRGHLTMSSEDLQSFKRLSLSLRRGIQWVKQFKRRVGKVQINKTWLVAVIIYLLAIIGKKTGMTFTDELANQIADIVLTFILPLVMALLSHRKGQTDEKRPVDTGSAV
jgi:hypothetical protein